MIFSDMVAAWTFAFFSLAILTYLWKVNYIYRIAEVFSVAAITAQMIITTYQGSIESPALIPIAAGQLWRVIPILFGLLVFTRIMPKYAWLSRYPIALLVGVGTGILFSTTFDAQILSQIGMTTTAFLTGNLLSAVVILVSMVTVLTYFIYTHEHTGLLGISARIGRVFAMFSFGMNYSGELIWYLTLIVGIIIKLYETWIKQAILGM